MDAILELDMPESCKICPLFNGYSICKAMGKFIGLTVAIGKERAPFCPLKPKPEEVRP